MISLDEAFRKFKSRLELNEKEQQNATKRHTEVREHIRAKLSIQRDFLTGSYARYTKTKPLKDIDIFFVLSDTEKEKYRKQPPSSVLDAFYDALVEKYGKDAVRKQGRSINVDFGILVDADDNTDYRVMSIDAVPAVVAGSDYEIPNADTRKWMKTNPEIHAEKARDAHQAFSSEWKGLVRMVKYWNNNSKHGSDKPVKPSFLIEVMALECLHGGWQGRFDYELQALFASLADRVHEAWPDPAGLGSHISDGMDESRKARAKRLLLEASKEASAAIQLARRGQNGDALKAWRNLFGPKFPLS